MAQTLVTRDISHDGAHMLERLVRLGGAVIIGLLTLRFIFMLLGANANNGIANFVYDASQPLVSPFFGLFNYTPQLGTSRVEFETLVAIVGYAILTAIVARLVSIGRRD